MFTIDGGSGIGCSSSSSSSSPPFTYWYSTSAISRCGELSSPSTTKCLPLPPPGPPPLPRIIGLLRPRYAPLSASGPASKEGSPSPPLPLRRSRSPPRSKPSSVPEAAAPCSKWSANNDVLVRKTEVQRRLLPLVRHRRGALILTPRTSTAAPRVSTVEARLERLSYELWAITNTCGRVGFQIGQIK